MAKQKLGTTPSTLATFQAFFNKNTARSSGQVTTKVFVSEGQLPVFAAYVEEMFPGVTPNEKLGNTLAQNGESQQIVYAVYHEKPGNNLQVYASGKGNGSGTMSGIVWPIPEKAYNAIAQRLGRPLFGQKEVAVVAKAKPAARRKAKPAEIKDADRVAP